MMTTTRAAKEVGPARVPSVGGSVRRYLRWTSHGESLCRGRIPSAGPRNLVHRSPRRRPAACLRSSGAEPTRISSGIGRWPIETRTTSWPGQLGDSSACTWPAPPLWLRARLRKAFLRTGGRKRDHRRTSTGRDLRVIWPTSTTIPVWWPGKGVRHRHGRSSAETNELWVSSPMPSNGLVHQ